MKNIDLILKVFRNIVIGGMEPDEIMALPVVYKGATICKYGEWRNTITFDDFKKRLYIKNIKINKVLEITKEGIMIA